MSSTDIVAGVNQLTKVQLLPIVNKKWLPQFKFGIQAYSLKAFHSATGNARQVIANTNTAARKSERLLANTKLADSLGTIFDGLNLVRSSSFINVDHSDMHGLMALVGAVQTRNGRALPAMVEVTYASTISAIDARPRWQQFRRAMVASRQVQSLTGHTIDSLQNFHDRLGFWPRLVFDRGFGNESLVTHLQAEGAIFYIRLKAGRLVEFDGQKTKVQQLDNKDSTITLFDLNLRVIRSPKSRRASQPWYILTNDFSSSREKIIKIYYHRFEIEETFKDMKHIFELKRTRFNKPNSLKTILWFVALGIALLYRATKPTKQTVHKPNPRKQISWLRQAYEQLQQASGLLLWSQG